MYDGEKKHEEGQDDSEDPLHQTLKNEEGQDDCEKLFRQTFSKGSSDGSSLKMPIHEKKIFHAVGEASH